MIKKLSINLRSSSSVGLFHDSRKDVNTLGKTCNILIDKINELVAEVNRLNNKISELENKE